MPSTIFSRADQLAPLVIENLSMEVVYPILYGSNSMGLELFCLRTKPQPPIFSKWFQLEAEAGEMGFFILRSLTSQRRYKPQATRVSSLNCQALLTHKHIYICPVLLCLATLCSLQPWLPSPMLRWHSLHLLRNPTTWLFKLSLCIGFYLSAYKYVQVFLLPCVLDYIHSHPVFFFFLKQLYWDTTHIPYNSLILSVQLNGF